ncbi:MAG TPA: YfiR family protein [Rhizomicrobium sp.]|nr:YfiR family protein [Rhizomicrobium sp.]
MLAAASSQQAFAQDTVEYEVKAAYLVKFAPFIEWPDGAFPSASAPLTICVAGSDPFGPLLDRAAAGQHDGERTVTIRRLGAPDAGCQVLFAGGDDQAVENELAAVKDRPILTVTDSGIRPHGIISFALIGNHVRFDIDETAADAVSIRISSKLLELAHAVKQGARR